MEFQYFFSGVGIDGGQIDSEYGGKSTISRLEVTPTEQDDGEIYACRATNELLEEAVSDAVTLNVLCKYCFQGAISQLCQKKRPWLLAVEILILGGENSS